jgi:hypothetical protein
MQYIVNSESKKVKLEVGSILQSNSNSEVYMIINMNNGNYGLLNLMDLEIKDYHWKMYKLVDNYFEKGFTVLTQTVPAVFMKEE